LAGPVFYLDACVIQRPYDGGSDPLVAAEAACVRYILANVESGRAELVWSFALDAECCSDLVPFDRRLWSETVRALSVRTLIASNATSARAREIQTAAGLRDFDALHVASAEELGAVLVTADRRMIQRARRASRSLRTQVVEPFAAAIIVRGTPK